MILIQLYLCNNNNICLLSNLNINNIIIYSPTGRISSTNILSMFNGIIKINNNIELNINNIGEIFISTRFKSLNLEPNNESPKKYPANNNHKEMIIKHIYHSFHKQQQQSQQQQEKQSQQFQQEHYIGSIKFYHAWENGVTVKWLTKMLINYGCVKHFILITRNPVRITISEQYGHKYHSWAYENVHSKKKKSLTTSTSSSSSSLVCEQSHLSYHIGGRWMSQMAVTHFNSFCEILSLFPYESPDNLYSFSTPLYSQNISILGLSYESDILISPSSAYHQIIKFLLGSIPKDLLLSSSSSNSQLKPINTITESKLPTEPRSKFKKGMTCLLSHVLVNFEELLCTFIRYDQNHLIYPLIWMTTNDDRNNQNITYTMMMKSWYELSNSYEFRKLGYLEECSLNDILQAKYIPSLYHDSNEINYLNKYLQIIQQFSSNEINLSFKPIKGYCSTGGFTSSCRSEGIIAIPSDKLEYCHLSLYRSKCNIMTIHNQKCYFHQNISSNNFLSSESQLSTKYKIKNNDYRLISCDENSYTLNRIEELNNL